MLEIEIDPKSTNRGGILKPGTGSRSSIRKAVLLIVIGVCVLGSGCRYDPTIWTTEIRSPGGLWIASARTLQNGGFGSAAIQTIVYVKRTDDSKPPEAVLAFWCEGPAPRPYVLDNANAGGTIHLTMTWVTPTHLEVTYDGHADLYSQVAKVGDIDISVRDLSSVEARSPDGNWLAISSTERHSGADNETNVYLKRTNDSRSPEKVLGFCSDAAEYRSGTIDLTLKWATPSHLDVTYDAYLSPDFQVAKYAGIDISVRNLSALRARCGKRLQ